jgi:hypothetical protein
MIISTSNLYNIDYILAPFNFLDIKLEFKNIYDDYLSLASNIEFFESKNIIGFMYGDKFQIYNDRTLFAENKKPLINIWNLQRTKQNYMIFASTKDIQITFEYVKKYMDRLYSTKEYEIFSWNDYSCKGRSYNDKDKFIVTVIDI